jgi:hypothetical protein
MKCFILSLLVVGLGCATVTEGDFAFVEGTDGQMPKVAFKLGEHKVSLHPISFIGVEGLRSLANSPENPSSAPLGLDAAATLTVGTSGYDLHVSDGLTLGTDRVTGPSVHYIQGPFIMFVQRWGLPWTMHAPRSGVAWGSVEFERSPDAPSFIGATFTRAGDLLSDDPFAWVREEKEAIPEYYDNGTVLRFVPLPVGSFWNQLCADAQCKTAEGLAAAGRFGLVYDPNYQR